MPRAKTVLQHQAEITTNRTNTVTNRITLPTLNLQVLPKGLEFQLFKTFFKTD